jgi:hypothetical protein
MKKLFLIGLMMLASSAWAEWVMYEETDTATHYFDPATIRIEGKMPASSARLILPST